MIRLPSSQSRGDGTTHDRGCIPLSEYIADDDPQRDQKMADRIAGRNPKTKSMHGPNRFAQTHLAPDWWHRQQRRERQDQTTS